MNTILHLAESEAVERVLERLEQRGCDPHHAGGGWGSRCPAHDDHTPSLSISAGNDGRALVKCHAGCDTTAVLSEIGLELKDLQPPRPAQPSSRPRTLATYDYVDEDGTLLFQVLRKEGKEFPQRQPKPGGGWIWNLKGVTRRPLYRLPQVLDAVANGQLVWVVEGEKDADALQRILPPGEVATTNAGGVGKWLEEHTDTLRDAKVVIWGDADDPGRTHAAALALMIGEVASHVSVFESSKFKDAAEHLGAGLTLDDLIECKAALLQRFYDLDQPGEHFTDAHEPPDVPETDSWARIELGPIVAGILAGTIIRTVPEIGVIVDDPAGLFAKGKVNGLHGAPGTGKTMTAEVVARQELEAGHTVWFIDFEDDPTAVAQRFLDLGTDPATLDRLHYKRPHEVLNDERADRLQAELEQDQPTLVIVDSTGEWMGLHGIEDKDVAVARFMATCARPLTSTGAAVVLLDHVPHADKERLAPIGSQRKAAAVNGCQYLLTTIAEMARGRVGKARITVAKDRTGTRPKGTIAAELLLDATTTPATAALIQPTIDPVPDAGPLAGLSPAACRVHAVLDHAPDALNVSQIGDLLAADGTTGTGLKKRTIQDALKRLEDAELATRTATGFGDLWSTTTPPAPDDGNPP